MRYPTNTLKFLSIVFLIASLFLNAAQANNLSIEKQIAQFVQSQQAQQLSLLKELVNINSGTTNKAGVYRTGEILRPYFEALGFKLQWREEPPSLHRAGTLIAEHPGSRGKKILLIGHLDTVFPRKSVFQSYVQRGNFITGPGIIDDKGGDVVILYALKALQAANVLQDANITVVLTGDEEDAGKPTSISRKPLMDIAKNTDIALDFEWAITSNTATIGRRGIEHWTVKTEGNATHSAKIFQDKVGFGAVFEIVRILDSMRVQLSAEKYLSFSPGIILGGAAVEYDKVGAQGRAFENGRAIAKTAMSKGDLRYLTTEQKFRAEQKMRAIVARHLPSTKASIVFTEGIPEMAPTSENLQLLQKYSAASEKLGYGMVVPLDPGARGAGDISHIASIVPASLAGLGPVGTGAHSEQETLDIRSLVVQTARAALLIHWLTQ